jgi:hypothetical protein
MVLPDDFDPLRSSSTTTLWRRRSLRPVGALEPATQETADDVIDKVVDLGGCGAVADITSLFTSAAFFRVVVGAPEKDSNK